MTKRTMYRRTELLTGWGRTAPSSATVALPAPGEDPATLLTEVTGDPALRTRGLVARGLGRSYGDAAQNGGGLVLTLPPGGLRLDPVAGTLTADAGTSIDEILRVIVPQGWFVPVTAGTRYVTVGGAIAADIHGKNHHCDGTFGAHVRAMDVLTADGHVHTVTPDAADEADRDLFAATVGGMGLTGVILNATFGLMPIETSKILVDTRRTIDLDDAMARMSAAHDTATYSVAWLDSVAKGARFGRGVLTTGEHAPLTALPVAARRDPTAYDPSMLASAPPFVPGGLLTPLTVRAFNEAWYRKAPKSRDAEVQSIAAFFHPLDGVGDWNRIYGPKGFLQYQFAVPDSGADVVRLALSELQRIGAPSFLSVLKRFGPENGFPLSFPMAGWTLALDLPAGIDGLGDTLDDLDEAVLAAGGRFYLAKDSRTTGDVIAAGYPQLDKFRAVKAAHDPNNLFRSDLSRRLGL
ncbi:MAG: decaprenylphospho-beta-D-ribofuranose 2-oxidase [Actinomycetota bacterium]|nr:decaprenylphospho-beta-D-ribofuranose 2-oxidase [Actinomycetota bacterium]